MGSFSGKLTRDSKTSISSQFLAPTGLQHDRLGDARRTYATWLVRAAHRKLADSEALESPDNSALIDLTSEGNKRTNLLVDNGIDGNEES